MEFSLFYFQFILDLYMKAWTAANGFVAEGFAYETEKEIGRGKRKRKRNRFFEDSDSEEIKKCKGKSVPAPSNVPFEKISTKNTTKEPKHGLNLLLPNTSSLLTKVSRTFLISKLILRSSCKL